MSQLKYKLSNLPLISAGEAAASANFFVSLSDYHLNHTYGEEKQISPEEWATKF
jgi:hypothetical protein